MKMESFNVWKKVENTNITMMYYILLNNNLLQ